MISGGSGADNLKGDEGADTIYLSGEQTHAAWSGAWNASSDFQTGTNEIVALSGLTQIDAVVDGGAGADTVALTSSSDAFFLHAALTSFHEDLSLSADYDGELSVPKFANVEIILAGDGDDVIDLTSPDYSLSGDTISIKGQDGDDTIWGSDANEEIIGGDGKADRRNRGRRVPIHCNFNARHDYRLKLIRRRYPQIL